MNNLVQSKLDYSQLEQLRKEVENIIVRFNDISRALFILNNLFLFFEKHEQEISSSQPDFWRLWRKTFAKLQFIVLHTLSESDILYLFQYYFTVIYNIPNYNLIEKHKARMLWFPLNKRDAFKKQIRQSLLQNKQLLTDHKIIAGAKELKGTVVNWIKDYNEKLGTGIIDKLKYAEYLSNSQSHNSLKKIEVKKLDVLLSFYEYLKHSSLTTGAEEHIAFVDARDGKLKILSDGQIIDADTSNRIERAFQLLKKGIGTDTQKPILAPVLKSSSIVENFNTLPVSLDIIHQKIDDLQKREKVNKNIVQKILSNSDKVKDKTYIVASLLLSSQRGEKQEKIEVKNMLERKLGWSARDSAKIGIRIGKLVGEEWGYYDKKAGVFKWT